MGPYRDRIGPVATTSSDSQYGGEVPGLEEMRIKITGLFVR